MRAVVWLAALFGSAGFAQTIVEPARIARLFGNQGAQAFEQRLDCDVFPIRPALNFGFRFQTGYVVRVPMEQYLGPGHGWGILAQVLPEGASQPVNLVSRIRLPDIPKTTTQFEVAGGYLVGAGRYHVNLALYDDQGRVCRKDWSVEARLTRGERKVKLTIPPRAVAEMSGRGLPSAAPAPADAPPFRLTVFMHAAPLSPRRTRMRASDRVLLVGSLASLLQRIPAQSVRLVVFNLDQQKELYREDHFTLDSLDHVTQSINELELGLVDIHTLQNRKGPLDQLASLVNQEIGADPPSGAVIFLGPATRYTDKPAQMAVAARAPSAAPRFFYFEYRAFGRGPGPGMGGGPGGGPGRGPVPGPPLGGGPATLDTDSIAAFVARLKGKTIQIYNPGQFAGAIEQLEKLVAQAR